MLLLLRRRLLLLLLRVLLLLMLLLLCWAVKVARQQHSTEDHLISAALGSNGPQFNRNGSPFQPPPPTDQQRHMKTDYLYTRNSIWA